MHLAALELAATLKSRGQEVLIVSADEARQMQLPPLPPDTVPIKNFVIEPIPVIETPMTGRESRRERRKQQRKKKLKS